MDSFPKSSHGDLLNVGNGGFKVTPKPRGGDWLRRDIENFKNDGFDLIVSMLTPEEEAELLLQEEEIICREMGVYFERFPILDRGVPVDRSAFEVFAKKIHSLLSNKHYGIFHCRAGLGRAPLLGCAVLMREGHEASYAWNLISNHRKQAVPDTQEQRIWVSSLDRQITTLEDALWSLSEEDAKETP